MDDDGPMNAVRVPARRLWGAGSGGSLPVGVGVGLVAILAGGWLFGSHTRNWGAVFQALLVFPVVAGILALCGPTSRFGKGLLIGFGLSLVVCFCAYWGVILLSDDLD